MPQILPPIEQRVAKLERRLREMPADHPKRASYQAQLDELRREQLAAKIAGKMSLEQLQVLAGEG